MCCLFGFYHYGNNTIINLHELTQSLAEQATDRGMDATGIAYNENGRMVIYKEAKSAYMVKLRHPDTVKCVTGHTRHATQGDKKHNYNNHPFSGSCKNLRFALSHNGILVNDEELKLQYNLPKSKVATDSYVAVQMLEKREQLDVNSVRFMAEKVEGSFAFSILSSDDVLWLVRGDSPLSLIHFPEQKLYVYASTDEILYKSLIGTEFFKLIKKGAFEEKEINPGDIIRIMPGGALVKDTFRYEQYSAYSYFNWWGVSKRETLKPQDAYIENLKTVAALQGYSPESVDRMLKDGFTPDEIEEIIYCCE